MLALLALSTGVFTDQFGLAFGSVRVVVRHKGPPLPFTFHIRTKETKRGEWEYLDDSRLSYYPRRLLTSTGGREYRIKLPIGLKTYSQICSRLGPPEGSYKERFQVLISVQSCANLPSLSQDRASIGWGRLSTLAVPVVNIPPLVGSAAALSKVNVPASALARVLQSLQS